MRVPVVKHHRTVGVIFCDLPDAARGSLHFPGQASNNRFRIHRTKVTRITYLTSLAVMLPMFVSHSIHLCLCKYFSHIKKLSLRNVLTEVERLTLFLGRAPDTFPTD